MRIPILLLSASLMASCDGPTELDASRLVGDWEIAVLTSPDCVIAQPDTIYFTVHDDFASKSLINIVTDWGFEPTLQYGWLLTGNMNTGTRTAELNLWHTPLQTGSMITASLSSDGILEGELRDPKPGYSPHYSWAPCYYDVRGRRVGPPTRAE